ncbi:MAG: DUF1883 domain-containing protein [Flavobacteriales bacterium]|nr:DUF1883 domain-containing protein [Flavobacteriales bacterium]
MKFLHQKFQAKKKEIVEVRLDKPARVKFMTASEFKRYTGARTHTFFGGHFDAGTVRFVLPFDSVWTAVVEKGTLSNPVNVKASVKLLPPDRSAMSSVALDAPAHVRAQVLLEVTEALTGDGNEG